MTYMRKVQVDHLTPEVMARFWPKVAVREEGECWLWLASVRGRQGKEYGQFRIPVLGWTPPAHVVAYLAVKGWYPEDLHLDHTCEVSRCVNPNHLEPVTNAENHARARDRRTVCRKGHPLTPDNVYRVDGRNRCRACRRIVDRRRYPRHLKTE